MPPELNAVFLVPVSVIGFSVASVACLAGLFSPHFRDNWLQHLGMSATAFASILKVLQISDRGAVSHETALLAVGVALFAAGVAYKVWLHERPKPPTRKRARGVRG